MSIDNFPPGARVRVRDEPGRTGKVTSEAPKFSNVINQWKIQVEWDDHDFTKVAINLLEIINENPRPEDDVRSATFHDVSILRRQLLHEKLSGKMSNILYSMETSNIEFHAYQFKPVFKLIESPTNGILIADEVGLGKTIETGLIWTELKARTGAKNLLVVCPPHLRQKWETELKVRFGVKASIVNAKELYKELGEWKNDKSHTFALISSYHSLRPPKGWELEDPGHDNWRVRLAHLLQDIASGSRLPVDLLAMDEVHYMRNQHTVSSALGELLCPIAEHRVFLSATPIHTENKNLFALLRLLDPDSYTNFDTFQYILEANEPLVKLRELLLRSDSGNEDILNQIDKALNNSMLKSSETLRQIKEIVKTEELSNPSLRSRLAYQVERSNLLGSTLTRSRKCDVMENAVIREAEALAVEMHPLEIKFYEEVYGIVRDYVEDTQISAQFLAVMPQRQISSCAAAALSRWLGTDSDHVSDIGNEIPEELPNEHRRPLISFLVDNLSQKFDPVELEKVDTKYDKLVEYLKDYWQKNPSKKILLFAFFKPTLRYLHRRLERDGISSSLLHGGIAMEKQDVVDGFRTDENINILLSSEVGGEGLDLQFASVLINYDLPWNPMVVEQRIGRIDRIGQKEEKILIINMIAKDTVDERIYRRLYERLDLFKRTLGDLGDVLGGLVAELQEDILTHNLNRYQQNEKIEKAELAVAEKLRQHEEMEEQAGILAAYGDFIIQKITGRHEKKQWINSSDIEVFITEFLNKEFPKSKVAGVDAENQLFTIRLDQTAGSRMREILSGLGMTGQTRIALGNETKVRFEHRNYVENNFSAETINQSHPLVKFACQYLRAERKLNPSPVAVRVSSSDEKLRGCDDVGLGQYVYVVQRWTFDGVRVIEQLFYRVCKYDTGLRMSDDSAELLIDAAAEGRKWEGAKARFGGEEANKLWEQIVELKDEADEAYDAFYLQCANENKDRLSIQKSSLENYYLRKLNTLEGIRDKHQENNRHSLVNATIAKIDNLANWYNARMSELNSYEGKLSGNIEVAMGVIDVVE